MSSGKVNGFINQKATGLLYLCTHFHREALGDDAMMRKKGVHSKHICRRLNVWINVNERPHALIFLRLGIHERGWGYRFNSVGIEEKDVVSPVLK